MAMIEVRLLAGGSALGPNLRVEYAATTATEWDRDPEQAFAELERVTLRALNEARLQSKARVRVLEIMQEV